MLPPLGISALIAVRAALAVGATIAASRLAHSAALTLMILFVALHSVERGYDAWFRGGDVARSLPSDLLVLLFALLGAAAWVISRLAEWRAGAQAGPGLALLLMIYATLLRDGLSDRLSSATPQPARRASSPRRRAAP